MGSFLEQLAIKLLSGQMSTVRLLAKDLEDRLALRGYAVPTLAKTVVDGIRQRALPRTFVFFRVSTYHRLPGIAPLNGAQESS